MRKDVYKLGGVLLISVSVFMGCNGTPAKVQSKQMRGEFANAPKWVLDPTVEKGLSAVGSAQIGKAGIPFARTEALAIGRDELARQLGVKVKNLVKNFSQVTGLGESQVVDKVSSQVSKQVAEHLIKGSKQKDLWISPSNQLYVLLTIDPAIAKNSIKESVESSYKNQKALWQQFQAKNAHEELEKEVDKEFGDFKKEK